MAIRRTTLRLLRKLTVTVGREADEATRFVTQAWLKAWDELSGQWRTAVGDVVVRAAQTGRWPAPWQLARVDRLARATAASEAALTGLAAEAGIVIAGGAHRVIGATATAEPGIIASQLPARLVVNATAVYAARVVPSVLDEIVDRTTHRITSLTRPLDAVSTEAVHRALVRGVAVGDNPTVAARDMVRRVEGAFNGGLTRATNVARTEILDAYRNTSAYAHTVNADVLSGWTWLSTLDRRTCAACWSMHGTEHPVTEPGPWDHQSGRCARAPKTKTWRELGIDLDEPADLVPDARAKWLGLPRAEQDAVFGPARAELVRSGQVDWSDLAVRRDSRDWRPSYTPRPVRDLEAIAKETR